MSAKDIKRGQHDGKDEGRNGWSAAKDADNPAFRKKRANDENPTVPAQPSRSVEHSEHTQEVTTDDEPNDVDPADQLLCDAEINKTHEEISTQQLEIDKQLLTLSSGLIVLSLTFAKDIVDKQPVSVWLLITGLTIIACCIGCVLFSYRWSIAGLEKAQAYWRARRGDTYGKHVFPLAHNKAIKVVNVVSCWLFGIGFAFITIFVTLNVAREMHMAKMNDGRPLNVPVSITPKRNDTAGTTVKVPTPPPPPPPAAK